MPNEVSRLFDLAGRTAAITGAGSGIGRATSILLAQAGANLVLGDIDERSMAETSRIIEDTGGRKPVQVRTDVSKKPQVEDLVQRAVKEFGRLDIMGNVAGIPQQSLVVDTKEEDLDRVLAINLKGVFFGCQAAMKPMTAQRSGNIVNISSSVIYSYGADTYACYGMAKAGVAMLTKVLAHEAGPLGIRVNAIAPGQIITNFSKRHFANPDGTVDDRKREAFIAQSASRSPLKLAGKPEYIAHAFLYLVSDASEFVTGQIIGPNGGVSMPW